jgi:hypothetical protein
MKRILVNSWNFSTGQLHFSLGGKRIEDYGDIICMSFLWQYLNLLAVHMKFIHNKCPFAAVERLYKFERVIKVVGII